MSRKAKTKRIMVLLQRKRNSKLKQLNYEWRHQFLDSHAPSFRKQLTERFVVTVIISSASLIGLQLYEKTFYFSPSDIYVLLVMPDRQGR